MGSNGVGLDGIRLEGVGLEGVGLDGVGLDPQRFQLLIGLGFLAIVFFSPDGVLGLWQRWRSRLRGRGNH